MSTIVENFDGNVRGIPLTTRDNLNKENARTKVATGSDLSIITPRVGVKLSGYTVAKIIDT